MSKDFIELRDELILYHDVYILTNSNNVLDKIRNITKKLYLNHKYENFSLWYGISGIELILLDLPKNVKYDLNIDNSFQKIIDETNKKITDFKENGDFTNLDLFKGAIGMIRFLLEVDYEINEKILNIINRLSKIILDNRNNLDAIFYKKKDNANFIDISISHGACSFILILYYSYKKGYRSDSIYNSIKILFHYIYKKLYKDNIIVENCKIGYIYPSNKSKYNWCYGSFSVVYSLWKINRTFNIFESYYFDKLMRKEILSISCDNLNTNLFICHGLSGLKLMLLLLEKDFPNIVLEKKDLLIKYEKNHILNKFENSSRKKCILTGEYSVLITEIIYKTTFMNSIIYKMLLLN